MTTLWVAGAGATAPPQAPTARRGPRAKERAERGTGMGPARLASLGAHPARAIILSNRSTAFSITPMPGPNEKRT